MNKWICFTVLILLHTSPATLGLDRVLEITGTERDGNVPVWISDDVNIVASDIAIFEWFFNDTTIAKLNISSGIYTYPITSPLPNIIASPGEFGSNLILGNVGHTYTGTYKANDSSRVYSLFMIVHEVNITSVEFNLINASDTCRAFLQINDVIGPSTYSALYRTVNSSHLTFTPANSSNTTSFQISDSHLNITDNSTSAEINIAYSFAYNNFSTVKLENKFLDVSLIKKPTIIPDGTPDNCTILIYHDTNVACVRNITYCLKTNNTEPECQFSTNLNNLTWEYPWNSTFANLSMVYDIIYAKYNFDINMIQCSTEAITSVEPTTMNSSPQELTTIQSGTNDTTDSGDTFNYSTYSSMSPSMFSTYLDTTTISLITASSELPNTTLSPTMNATVPPIYPEYFADWKIALIIVGSFIGIVLLGGGIGFLLWKTKSRKPSNNRPFRTTKIKPIEMGIRSAAEPSSDEHVVQRSIPQPKPTNPLQVQHDRQRPLPPITLSTSAERTDRQSQSLSQNQTIRPTIPPPASKSYAPSNRQEARASYGQFSHSPASQSVLPPLNRIHQQQVPDGQRRPLPATSDV